MEEAGFQFDVLSLDVDETVLEDVPPYLRPEHLALRKAKAALNIIETDSIVIGADSMVFLKDQIFEKPVDEKDAFRMLAHLSGKTHLVITGVALLTKDKQLTFSSRTRVTMRPMDKDEIDYYIQNFQPFDKAGSYGIQDWLGHCKVSEIEGTYTNVMGLPVDLVYEGLKQLTS